MLAYIKNFYQLHLEYLFGIVALALFFFFMLDTPYHELIYVPLVAIWLFFIREAFYKLQERILGTELFVVIAALFACFGGQLHAIIIIFILLLMVHYIEFIIDTQTKKSLSSLLSAVPTTVIVIEEAQEKIVSIDLLALGSIVLVKTGMKIAVDGKVISGNALVNEAPLTGESVAKEKQIGDTVYAGTFLESGNLFIKTEKIKQETVFGKMTKLLLDAQDKKASLVIITNKIATIFTPLVLCIIALVWIFTGDNNLVTTLLVFGSPLELSLIAPLTLLAGSIAAFKKGILIKSGWALEHMARIDTFIFDKTGTLTKGNPKVIDIQSCNKNYTPQDILQLCAIAQKYSDAAFSRAICHAAEEQKIIVPYPEAYESLVGHGVKITYKNNIYLVGNKHFLEAAEHGNIYFPESIKPSELSGTLFLASEHDLLGFLSLADSIRPEAKEVVKQLRMSGINTIMIVSGDKKAVVEKIAQEVGIDLFYGEMFPEQKLAILEDLQKRGKIVAMVGDGLNDALALKYATVGIALGALGVEPAIEAANIVLMTSNLNQIVFIRKLSQRIVATIYQNLIIGFLCVHILGFLCAMAGYISPITAALFHSLSDILILLNSARLSFKK